MFRRIKNISLTILCLAGVAFFGQNFSPRPKSTLAKSVAASLPKQVQKDLGVEAPDAESALPAKKYVRIDGQLFEYNPRHVYMVKGVPTYYVDNSHKSQLPPNTGTDKEIEDPQPTAPLADKNPLTAYSPKGFSSVLEETSRLRKDMHKRAQDLRTIDE